MYQVSYREFKGRLDPTLRRQYPEIFHHRGASVEGTILALSIAEGL